MDWWQQASHVIILPWVTIALLVAGCLLLFHDLLTPLTWGITGSLGVICLGAVFAAQIATGSAGWIGVILLLAGLALLLVETHLLPGQGIPATFGLILLFAGMFLALGGNENAAFALGVSTVLTITAVFGFFAYLPKSPVWKKLGQQMQQNSELGYRSSESQMYLLGRSGVAVTVLRPSGIAQIDGQRVDVVTEGDFLEAGVPIVVTEVEGARVVVEKKSEERRSVGVG